MKKTKLLFLSLLTFGYQSFTYSQGGVNFKNQSELVHRLPNEASGFLILNAYENLEVVKWEITFLKPDFNGNGQISAFSVDRIVELENTYFTKQTEISENSNSHGFISINGYNSSNTLIVTDGPIAYDCYGCDTEQFCRPGCNGDTYAYQINVVGPPNGGSGSLNVSGTVLPNGNPFYRYFSATQWNTFTNSQTDVIKDHYGFPLSSNNGYPYVITLTQPYYYNPQSADQII